MFALGFGFRNFQQFIPFYSLPKGPSNTTTEQKKSKTWLNQKFFTSSAGYFSAIFQHAYNVFWHILSLGHYKKDTFSI